MLRKPVEGALFDMDGLLLDTEAVYIEALQAAARSLGREMPLSLCHSTVGVPGSERTAMIEQHYGEGFSMADFRTHFSVHVRGLLDAGVPLKPGALELLDFLAGRGLPLAVATSARRVTAETNLAKAGLLGRFKALATRDDVERTKPAPDLYLEAARRLGVAPRQCVAVEDSSIGILAAHAAGMRALMVVDILPPTDEARARCLHVAADLHEVLELIRPSFGKPL